MKTTCFSILLLEVRINLPERRKLYELTHTIISKHDVVREKGQWRDEIREANVGQIRKAFVCCSRRIKFYPAGYRKVFKNFKGKRSSVQFSHSVVSNSLWPHGLQHTRAPSPSPTARVYSNSCPSSRWCHPTISSSVVPFSCLQSFPASGSFQMSHNFPSGGQSVGVSTSASVFQWVFRTDFL